MRASRCISGFKRVHFATRSRLERPVGIGVSLSGETAEAMTGRANRVARKRWQAAGAALLLLAPGAFAADASPPDDAPNPYSGYSDQELSDLSARWESLGDDQRRWLFIETRKRMVANGDRVQLQVSERARFGHVPRGGDWPLLRLEGVPVQDGANSEVAAALPAVRAARKEPEAAESGADAGDGFGTGFERRRVDADIAPDARAGRPAPPRRSGKRRGDRRS